MATPTPFPLFCVGFAVVGFGSGLVIGLAAAFVTKLPERQNLKMCLFQACYGELSLASPIPITAVVTVEPWFRGEAEDPDPAARCRSTCCPARGHPIHRLPYEMAVSLFDFLGTRLYLLATHRLGLQGET
jgi:hypothetical protein